MKSKNAKIFLDTWVTKVKGYSTPVVSYDDAVQSVELAEEEMKSKAIEAFNEAMIYYTSPACTKDEEALKYFRAYLGQELDSSCSEKPNDLICGNCDAFCECVMGPYGVDCNDSACPRFDDSSLSQLKNKDHE